MTEFKSAIEMEADLGKSTAGWCQLTVCQTDKSPTTTTATYGVVALIVVFVSEFFREKQHISFGRFHLWAEE